MLNTTPLRRILGLVEGRTGHLVYQNSVYILSTDRLGYFQFSVRNWQKLQKFSAAEDAAMLEGATGGNTVGLLHISRGTMRLCYSFHIAQSTPANYHTASPGSLQHKDAVPKLGLSHPAISYKGTQFCSRLPCKRKKKGSDCVTPSDPQTRRAAPRKARGSVWQPAGRAVPEPSQVHEGELNTLLRDELLF